MLVIGITGTNEKSGTELGTTYLRGTGSAPRESKLLVFSDYVNAEMVESRGTKEDP